MKRRDLFRCGLAALTAITVWLWAGTPLLAEGPKARNVILFIGDGMGKAQIEAAGMWYGAPFSFQTLPHQAESRTRSADNVVTDSAASATAMSTGVRVNNNVVALRIPGDSGPIETILESAKKQGRWVGLVTNDELTHATPACFGAHVPHRDAVKGIAEQYFEETRPHVLFGGGQVKFLTAEIAESNGYTTASDAAGLKRIVEQFRSENSQTPPQLAAVFGKTRFPYVHVSPEKYGRQYPYLHEMTTAALRVLERSEKGFFVMVESALTDKSGHSIDLRKDSTRRTASSVKEVLELSKAVRAALDWAAGRDDTLIIVTADHETGGLKVNKSNGAGKLPDVEWSHTNHSGANVMIYAVGPGAERFKGVVDNTLIYDVMAEVLEIKRPAPPAVIQ